tara:strand:+ start:1513 stop:1788 length:276 start_codon:yes stop_codon:yes gene_type:complete
MTRIVPNKCVQTRVEIEGKAYRVISFFHSHPSEVEEDAWTLFRHNEEVYIVDKITLSVMAECQCELLAREIDNSSSDSSIVSVKLTDKITL